MTALTIIAGYIAGAFIGGLIVLALWRPMLYLWNRHA